ncbi:MAG: hypothetical protein KAX80_03880 [Planctomycetes bacterium]|nr:hypothetical protein [Planctomycetota bacterium]
MAFIDTLNSLFGKKKTLADLTDEELKEKLYGLEHDRDTLKSEIDSVKGKIGDCYTEAMDEESEELEDDKVMEIERLENKRNAALARFERATQDVMVLDELIEIQKDKKMNRITTDLKTIDLAKVKAAVDEVQKEGEMNRAKLRELLSITAEARQVTRERSTRQDKIKDTIARARRLRESGKEEQARRVIKEASRNVRRREAEEI